MRRDRVALLVHGFASSSASSWRRYGWFGALESRGLRVIAPAPPRHGSADKPVDPAACGSIEDTIHAHAVGREPLDGVGVNLGGVLRLTS